MTAQKFAALKGVSRQALHAAVERGDVPREAVSWRRAGKRRVLVVTNVPLAATWTPAEQPDPPADEDPGELTSATSAREAKRHLLIFKAKQAKLEYELAAKQVIPLLAIQEKLCTVIGAARNAFLRISTAAMARIPHLNRDDAYVLEDIAREILTDLAGGFEESMAAVTAAEPSSGASS